MLPGFSPNQKFWGAVAPPPPTPVDENVELLCFCVQGTFSNLLPKLTAERKALYALCFLLYSTLQRCYCVKDVCLQAL